MSNLPQNHTTLAEIFIYLMTGQKILRQKFWINLKFMVNLRRIIKIPLGEVEMMDQTNHEKIVWEKVRKRFY